MKISILTLVSVFSLWKGHTDELWGLDVHPSTEQFVTCGQDKQVYLWDTSSHLPLWSKAIEVCMNSVYLYIPVIYKHKKRSYALQVLFSRLYVHFEDKLPF